MNIANHVDADGCPNQTSPHNLKLGNKLSPRRDNQFIEPLQNGTFENASNRDDAHAGTEKFSVPTRVRVASPLPALSLPNARPVDLGPSESHHTSDEPAAAPELASEHRASIGSHRSQRKAKTVIRKFQKLDASQLSSTPAPDVKIGQRVAYKEYYGNEFGTIRWIGECFSTGFAGSPFA